MSLTGNPINKEIEAADALLGRFKYLAYAGAFIAASVVLAYFVKFGGILSPEQEHWGQFGDFVGGVLNPAFSFLALLALLSTFALQVRELRLSARELKNSADALARQNETLLLQNFENSFFQLLRLYNEIVNSIDLASNKNNRVTKGRDCFKVFVDRLEAQLINEGADKDFETFCLYYDLFYIGHQHEIGHYFQLLYNIIKLVKRTDGIDKRFYTNIIRAQLSSYELQLLFYNGISNYGIEKFKPLIEEFAILKTLPTTTLPNDALLHKYSVNAFGGEYPEPLL